MNSSRGVFICIAVVTLPIDRSKSLAEPYPGSSYFAPGRMLKGKPMSRNKNRETPQGYRSKPLHKSLYEHDYINSRHCQDCARQSEEAKAKAKTYELGRTHLRYWIRCRRCQKMSFSTRDINLLYCANCNLFHERFPLTDEL